MGLLVTSVTIDTLDGDNVTSLWVEVEDLNIKEKPITHAVIKLTPFRSEAIRDAGSPRNRLRVSDDQIPNQLGNFTVTLTPAQYADLNVGVQVYNNLVQILEEGDAAAAWALSPELQNITWAGFGVGNVAIDLPS